jgi:hypothetical protein
MNFREPAKDLEPPALGDELRADRGDGIPETLYKINELLFLIALGGQEQVKPPAPAKKKLGVRKR